MPDNDEKTPVIEAVGLTKIFKDFWGRPKAKAVNDIDFEVYEGEVVGFLGPNGSGKSTTVKMLLGLLYPTAGQLKIFSKSPRDVAIKKRIGYLPEESYLYKFLTAFETLDFFGALFNLSAKERKSRAEQLLDMVGLSHAKYRQVGEFSKGMQRRIGLAQAMINDPDLLILDEPTSGLDPIGCREVKDLIKLLKERGKTVFITSHLLSDMEDVCDRVIILYGGHIRATGTLKDLLLVRDASRITTPLLPAHVTEKLLDILRKELKGEKFSIDHPKKTLEQFFLEIIEKAKEERVETSGVMESGKIADYLKEEGKPEQILEELVQGSKKETESDKTSVSSPVQSEESRALTSEIQYGTKEPEFVNISEEEEPFPMPESIDKNKKLRDLVVEEDTIKEYENKEESTKKTVKEEDLTKVNEKLKDLL